MAGVKRFVFPDGVEFIIDTDTGETIVGPDLTMEEAVARLAFAKRAMKMWEQAEEGFSAVIMGKLEAAGMTRVKVSTANVTIVETATKTYRPDPTLTEIAEGGPPAVGAALVAAVSTFNGDRFRRACEILGLDAAAWMTETRTKYLRLTDAASTPPFVQDA